MALMVSEIYDALKEAGASEDKARKAAEAVAQYDSRLAAIERKLDVLTYMVGVNIVVTLGLFWKVFTL
jgi:hypothetical protein